LFTSCWIDNDTLTLPFLVDAKMHGYYVNSSQLAQWGGIQPFTEVHFATLTKTAFVYN